MTSFINGQITVADLKLLLCLKRLLKINNLLIFVLIRVVILDKEGGQLCDSGGKESKIVQI